MAWNNTHCIDLELSSSQYLSHATNVIWDLSTGSIEAWINLESDVGGTDYTIISTETGGVGFALKVTSSTGNKLAFSINGGTGHVMNAGSTTLSLATWYHVAVAWDTAGAKIYLNGVQDATVTDSATISPSTNELRIGNSSVSTRLFDGKIDDIRIWNTKKTAADILASYRKELVGTETGLVSYWKLDNALTDSTTSAQTLTNNSAAVFSTSVPFIDGSFSDSMSPTESLSISVGWAISNSDSASPTESLSIKFGWGAQTKNSATFTPQNKS